MHITRRSSKHTGQGLLERGVRVHILQGADVAELLVDVFILVLVLIRVFCLFYVLGLGLLAEASALNAHEMRNIE
jgi:hypothetical protein